MSKQRRPSIAYYFGLRVEVIVRMTYYSIIRFGCMELVVETADLVIGENLSKAA